MSTHALKVAVEYQSQRLDIFLTQNLPHIPSRSFIKKAIDAGLVHVNTKVVKAHYKMREGDEVSVQIPEEFLAPEHITPENIPLDIFYEDKDFLIINKPSGMLVHPAPGIYTGTLVNALLFRCQELSDMSTFLRAGIVHRLDQETSGLMVVAKSNMVHVQLAKQFKDHLVRKQYIALVQGEIEFDEGKIDAPVGRNLFHRDKMDVVFDNEGREAVTFYRVIKRTKGLTLVALFPRTGRTHQLRVHMLSLKHPILGDEKYGRKETFPRLALHAQSIGFTHPSWECFVEFSSIPPKEFLAKVGL